MFEALKKIMTAAEELGDISKFTVSEWSSRDNEYWIVAEGADSAGTAFKMEVTLKFPVLVTDETEVGE